MEMPQRKLPLTWLVQYSSVCSSFYLSSYFRHCLSLFKTACLQVENGFILLLEREMFIDQLKDIVDKAEDMLHEDMEGERASTLSCSPQQGHTYEGLVGEVRLLVCAEVNSYTAHACGHSNALTNLSLHRISSLEHLSQFISRTVKLSSETIQLHARSTLHAKVPTGC